MRLLDTRVILRRLIAAAVVSASIAATVGAAAPAGQDPAAINDGRTGRQLRVGTGPAGRAISTPVSRNSADNSRA